MSHLESLITEIAEKSLGRSIDQEIESRRQKMFEVLQEKSKLSTNYPFETDLYYSLGPVFRVRYILQVLLRINEHDLKGFHDLGLGEQDIAKLLTLECKKHPAASEIKFISILPEHIYEIINESRYPNDSSDIYIPQITDRSLKNDFDALTQYEGLLIEYKRQVEKLEHKDINFVLCDIDDTLRARERQLQEPILRENRGDDGNQIMINSIGIPTIRELYYQGRNIPDGIIDTLDPEKSLLLTAGVPEFQHMKTEHEKLSDFPIKIAPDGKSKIMETLRYIVYELKYIPKEITIYEDRPHYFIQYKDLIEQVLGTQLHIKFVEMDGNRGYSHIIDV